MSPEPAVLKQTERSPSLRLFLIVVLGLSLRLAGWIWGQAYIHFGQGDGIEAYSVATECGLGEPRAVYLGQPNYNAHAKLPGPLWAFFCLFWCRFWGSIEGVVVVILLLNTVVIYLTYLLAEQTVGSAAGLWAALLSATSPWMIYYSVGVYNPEVMGFLGALLFLTLWRAARSDRAKVIFWVPVLLLVMLQFHMSGLMLIPAVVLVLWLWPARLHIPWLFGGFLAGLSLYLPYIHGEIAHSWQNTHGMFSGGGVSYSWDVLKVLSAPLSFLVSWAPRWCRSAADYCILGRACFGSFAVFLGFNILSAAVAAFIVAGAFLEIRKSASGFWGSPRAAVQRAPGLLFLAILFVIPLLVALAFGIGFHTRYCIVLLPVMMPLATVGVLHWLGAGRPGRIFRLGLVLTCCANVWLMPAMYRFQGLQIDQGPSFIPSFRKLETVYQGLKAHAGPGTYIRIDDAAYVRDAPLPDRIRRDAGLIQAYVNVREREAAARASSLRSVTYRLCQEIRAKPGDPAVAYRGNGIALVALSAEP